MIIAEVELAVGVGDHDEVVAGAVTFREGDGLRHPPSLWADGAAPPPRDCGGTMLGRGHQSATSRLPVVVVSNRSYPSES